MCALIFYYDEHEHALRAYTELTVFWTTASFRTIQPPVGTAAAIADYEALPARHRNALVQSVKDASLASYCIGSIGDEAVS